MKYSSVLLLRFFRCHCEERRDDLLLSEATVKQIKLLRRMVSMISSDGPASGSTDITERVIEHLRKTRTNADFLASLGKERL